MKTDNTTRMSMEHRTRKLRQNSGNLFVEATLTYGKQWYVLQTFKSNRVQRLICVRPMLFRVCLDNKCLALFALCCNLHH